MPGQIGAGACTLTSAIHNRGHNLHMIKRLESLGVEIANSASPGLGLLVSVGAAPVLIATSRDWNSKSFFGAVVFAATMVLLYLTSTLYHALPNGRAKRVWLRLDYCAIFLFIAGNYTPFAVGAQHGPWGWTLLGPV